MATVEFEDPAGDVVQEIAIMGHGNHSAGVVMQKVLQPGDGLGVEVVGRFVQQQHVGFRQQQLAQRDTPPLAAGKGADVSIPRRQSQRIRSDFELTFEVVAIGGLQDVLEFGLTLRQGVEIGVGFGIGCVDRVQFSHCLLYVAQCLLDVAAYVLVGIQLWFLRQVADLDSGLWACLAVDVRIDPGHDPQQRGFSRTVQTEHADLGTRKKGQ